jgi:hypothetical protein
MSDQPRKFYRTVIEVEVLSEDFYAYGEKDLADIAYDITEGHYNGNVEVKVGNEVIDGPTAATMLIRSGSDPGFFSLDADGNEVES